MDLRHLRAPALALVVAIGLTCAVAAVKETRAAPPPVRESVTVLDPTLASVPINISTAATTQLVAASGVMKINVSHFDVIAGGAGTIQFVYGTGALCATGQTILTGAYPLTAQAGLVVGVGLGSVLVIPAGNALCAVTVGAVQYSGSLTYAQF